MMKRYYGDGLRLLMIVSGLVLLIACANLANLLLARRTAGRVQSSIRTALGAPRSRLVRQTLLESLLLAFLGGVAGLLVATLGADGILLLAFRGADFVPIHTEPSRSVLLFAFALSLVTGVVFGLVPAWIAARFDPADVLRGVESLHGKLRDPSPEIAGGGAGRAFARASGLRRRSDQELAQSGTATIRF